MRVLMLSWEYPPLIEGGLARHVGKLAEQLVADGVEVDVLTRVGSGAAAGEGRCRGVTVHRIAQPPFPRDLDAFLRWVTDMNGAMTMRAAALTDAHAFDLVHSHEWLVADAARVTAGRIGRPWLVTVHATESGRHAGRVQAHPQSVIHAAERAMVADADHVITCSRYMREHIVQVLGVAPRRVTALRNGIDLAERGEPAASDPAFRARFADPDEPLVLLVGRLVHEKGFQLALDALAPLGGGVRFVVAGTGPAEAELRRQARRLRLDRTGTFLGRVGDADLRSLYAVADVCLVPSLYEPFGIVALEAMAAGCPCLVADTGGLREIVPGDERVGLRFAAGDRRALGAALGRLLDDAPLRRRMADAGRVHVVGFDWAAVARATRAVYAAVLEAVPARA